MTRRKIALTVRADDVEHVLRDAAFEAAKFGSLLDHVHCGIYDWQYHANGRETFDSLRARWLDRYTRAKRLVEAFGVWHEQPSEAETLTVHVPMKNEKRERRVIAGLGAFTSISGGEPDLKNARPAYRRGVHEEACKAAAARVVRTWRASLEHSDSKDTP